MAVIVENLHGRRLIRLSTDDVISVVKEYQNCACESKSYLEIREKLNQKDLYLPEDF